MNTDDLHIKYAPIMHFSAGERFFPMAAEEFLRYTALHRKGEARPVLPVGAVTVADLARAGPGETFLRSVPEGPLFGAEVAGQWGGSTLRLLDDWSSRIPGSWTETLARSAYDWFSEKTRPATRRFWWNDLLLAKAFADRASGARAELPRFILPGQMRDAAVAAYRASQGAQPNFTYYYRLAPAGEYLNLQYWFFYAYNDWANGYGGFNDHEGDWEGFHLFFKLDGGRPVEPPAYLCYLGHHSRMTKPWAHPDVEKDSTHPAVYVAAGSHASYPQPRQYPLMALYNLIDYATGDSFTLDHTAWRGRIPLAETPWLTYLGSWGTRYWLPVGWLKATAGRLVSSLPGEVALPGVSAPRGPRFTDSGDDRESWQNPLAFAGIT